MNPKATYEITSRDRSQKGIKSAKKGVTSLSKAGVKSAALMIAKWAAVAVSIKTVTKAVSASIAAFEEQESVEIKLAAAARNNPLINGEAYRGLTDYASAMQEVTMFGDEAILQQASFLTSLQLNEEEIKNVLEAATNLASTGLMSLERATQSLSKQYGGLAGQVGEFVPQLKDLTEEQLKAGEGIALINEQYEGFAETVAGSTKGIKENLKNMWGDFGEEIGSALAPLQTAIIQKVKPVLDAMSKWFAAHSTQITNFFLHIPEVAALSFNAIRKGFAYAFSFKGIWERLQAYFDHMRRMFVATFEYLSSMLVRVGESWILIFGQVFSSIWDTVKRLGQTLWSPLTAGFEWSVYGIRGAWRKMIEGLATGLQWLINNPINWLGQAFYDVAHGVGNVFEFMIGGVISMIDGMIDKLNWVIHLAQQVKEHGIFSRNYEAFDPDQGVLGGLNREAPNIEWGTGFQDFSADIVPQWEEALSPPDREIGSEISEVWKGYADTFVNDWKGTFEDIGGKWEGFGGDLSTYLEAVASSGMELNKDVLAPFWDEIKAMGPELNALLTQELPFEIRSVVQEVVDRIDEGGEEAVNGISNSLSAMNRNFYDLRMESGEALETWDYFKILLKMKGAELKAAFNGFISGITDNSIVDGFKGAFDFLKLAITEPKNAIAEAGFSLFRNLDSLANGLETVGSGIVKGFAFLSQGLLSFANKIISILQSTEAFQEVMTEIGDVISELAEQIIVPLIDAARPLIDVLISIVRVIATTLEPVLKAIGQVLATLAPVFQALQPLFQALGNVLMALMPVLEMVAQALVTILIPIIDILAQVFNALAGIIETLTPVIGALLNIVMAVLEPVITLIGDLMNIILPLLQLVADVLGLLTPILDALAEIIGAILTPILGFLGELLQAVLIPIIQVLSSVINALTPVFQVIGIILKAITPILNIFGQLLMILAQPLAIIGELMAAILVPLFELLGLVLEPLVPIFDILAKVIDAATRPLEFLADVVTYVVDVFGVVGHNLIQFLLSMLTFGFAGGDFKAMPTLNSDAFDRPLGESGQTSTIDVPSVGDISTGYETTPGGGSVGDIGGRGASYGGQNLTVNVSIEAEAIVGEPGLREFAIMIDDEIRKARNLGVV